MSNKKEYSFSYTFSLNTGVSQSFVSTSDTKESAEKLQNEIIENLTKAAKSTIQKAELIFIQPALAVKSGKVDVFWVGGVKEK